MWVISAGCKTVFRSTSRGKIQNKRVVIADRKTVSSEERERKEIQDAFSI